MSAAIEVTTQLAAEAEDVLLERDDTYIWIVHGNVYRYYIHKEEDGDSVYRLVVYRGDGWDNIGEYVTLDEARSVRDEWKRVLYARECLHGNTDDLDVEIQFKIIDASIEDWEDLADDLPYEPKIKKSKK